MNRLVSLTHPALQCVHPPPMTRLCMQAGMPAPVLCLTCRCCCCVGACVSCGAPFPCAAVSRHRSVMNLFQKFPALENNVFVAPSASVVGNVTILDSSSVWYGAVVRGDFNDVEIGAYTSVGTGAVVQTAPTPEGHANATVRIGDHVTIGECFPRVWRAGVFAVAWICVVLV